MELVSLLWELSLLGAIGLTIFCVIFKDSNKYLLYQVISGIWLFNLLIIFPTLSLIGVIIIIINAIKFFLL